MAGAAEAEEGELVSDDMAPDTQREPAVVVPIEAARARIRRQVARCKVELAEELLREALPTLRDEAGIAEDIFRRLRRLALDFDLRLKRQKPAVDAQDPAEEETLP